ncbi:MAG: aspartate dehydrogenase [Candidatus Aenigmarchaeota archaeon]|nr:aspartate dehydrogenase [Candidatus Aenigmarchaeota archaeon]
MKIALIGCGNIGTIIAKAIEEKKVDAKLECVYDIIEERGKEFAKKFVSTYKKFDDILKEDLDLIIEAASQEAVRTLIPRALKAKKNVMIMSAGALVDEKLFHEIKELTDKNRLKVYIPSGAIAGLDGIKSANIIEIENVMLKTRKPPKSLEGAPFFEKYHVNLNDIKNPTIIYEGPAKEAVRLFPQNVNIAASLSLAGIGPEKTKVQIIADPNIKSNIHEIIAEGKFGVLKTRVENIPSPDNPKTSYLAALSAIATLKKITEPIQIGT